MWISTLSTVQFLFLRNEAHRTYTVLKLGRQLNEIFGGLCSTFLKSQESLRSCCGRMIVDYWTFLVSLSNQYH